GGHRRPARRLLRRARSRERVHRLDAADVLRLAGGRRMTKRVHLAVIGVNWPPETFIRRKLRGLAAAGFDVTVCSPDVLARRMEDGIRLLPQPRLARDARTLLVALAWSARSAIAAPRRTLQAW